MSLLLLVGFLRLNWKLQPYNIEAFTLIEQREVIANCVTIYFGLLFVQENVSTGV